MLFGFRQLLSNPACFLGRVKSSVKLILFYDFSEILLVYKEKCERSVVFSPLYHPGQARKV